jgi:hypothetical protein
LISSALFDFPTGPAIVCALALVAGIAALTLGRAPAEKAEASGHEPIPLRRHSQAAGE